MADVPRPTLTFHATFADGDGLAKVRLLQRRYLLKRVLLLKLGGVGGVGDTMTVSSRSVTFASFDLDGVAQGAVVEDNTLVEGDFHPGDDVTFQPAVGAADNGCRVFVEVVEPNPAED